MDQVDTQRGQVDNDATAAIQAARSRLVDFCLVYFSVIMPLVLPISLYRALDQGWRPVFTIHLIVSILTVLLAIFRKQVPYLVRIAWIIGGPFILGIVGLLTYGVISGGAFCLFVFSVLVALFLGSRAGFTSMAFALVVLIIICFAVYFDAVTITVDLNSYSNSLGSWIIQVVAALLWVPPIVFALGFMNRAFESALKESQEYHAKQDRLADNLLDAMLYRHNKDGVFTYVSSSVSRILGFTAEEFLIDYRVNFTDHPVNKMAEVHTEASIRGEQQPPYEIEVLNKTGEKCWLLVSETPIRDENGNYGEVEGIAHDITKRKRLEEALKSLVESTSSALGDEFFEAAVLTLSRNLEADAVMIGKLVGTGEPTIKTYAVVVDGDIVPEVQYTLEGTPCEVVFQQGIYVIEEAASKKYADCTLLQKLPVEGYVGVPLKSSKGEVFGVIVTLFRKPIAHAELVTTLLQIIAKRVESEMERLEADEALREKDYLIESASSGIITTDLEGNISYVNPAQLNMWGYSSADEVLGRHFSEFVLIQDHGEEILNSLFNEGTWSNPLRAQRRDRTQFDIQIAAATVTNSSGDVIGLMASCVDITDLVRAEAALLESERWYSTFFDSASDTLLTLKRGIFVDCNKKALEMFRCSREDFIGKTPAGFSPPVQPDGRDTELCMREKFHSVMEGKSQFFPWRHKRADGTEFDAEVSLNAMVLDSEVYIQAVVRDVTERVQAQAEISRLATIIEQASESVMITDLEANLVYVNSAFTRITGYERDEVIGKNPRLLKSGEHTLEFYQKLWRTLTAGDTWAGVFKNRTKDGLPLLLEATISSVRDTAGQITHYAAVSRDITHERELEEQLRQSQKMEAIGTLAGGIAHDFNNILGAVIGFAQIVRDDVSEGKIPLLDEIDEILRAGDRAKQLVKQILTFSRKAEPRKEPTRIDFILDEISRLLRGALPSTIAIKVDIEEGVPLVNADTTQIHQVIMNLCTNAAHAMGNSTGTLSLRLSNVVIDKSEAAIHPDMKMGSYACLEVADTGHGMSPSVRERIFEPFFSTKGQGEGTGMGLSVVHGIVVDHEGVIMVDSTLGQGSKFSVYFPCISFGNDEDLLVEQNNVPLGGSERVMVVDDESALRGVLGSMLKSLGYQVAVQESAAQALKAIREDEVGFDIILTDMTMPEMTGLELMQELKSIGLGVPVILCTGYADKMSPQKAREMGFAAFLTKPLTKSTLSKALRSVLDSKN